MAATGGDDHCIIVTDSIGGTVDIDHPLPFLNAVELIAVVMHLGTNFPAGLKRHQDELEVVADVEHAAEVFIVEGRSLDILAIALH